MKPNCNYFVQTGRVCQNPWCAKPAIRFTHVVIFWNVCINAVVASAIKGFPIPSPLAPTLCYMSGMTVQRAFPDFNDLYFQSCLGIKPMVSAGNVIKMAKFEVSTLKRSGRFRKDTTGSLRKWREDEFGIMRTRFSLNHVL